MVRIGKEVADFLRFHAIHRWRIASFEKGRRPKQVLFICPNFDVGGGERVALDIMRHCVHKAFDFHALTTDRWPRHRWKSEFDAVCLNAVIPENWRLSPGGYLRYLSEVIARLGIDVLVVYENLPTFEILPMLKSRYPRLRCIDITHCEYEDWRFEPTVRAIPHLAARVCISEPLRQSMLDHYRARGLSERFDRRLITIRNGIEVPDTALAGDLRRELKIPENARIVCWAARFTAIKNPLAFIAIAERLAPKFPDVVFILAGDGPEMPEVKRRHGKSKLGRRLIVPGMLAPERIGDLLAESELYIMTSSIEGVPLILGEAMLRNTLVATTDCGAVRELVIDGETGIVVEQGPRMIGDLTTAATTLLGKPPAGMREKAREYVETHYSIAAMARSYAEVLSSGTGR